MPRTASGTTPSWVAGQVTVEGREIRLGRTRTPFPMGRGAKTRARPRSGSTAVRGGQDLSASVRVLVVPLLIHLLFDAAVHEPTQEGVEAAAVGRCTLPVGLQELL